jgi:hypothetical protein
MVGKRTAPGEAALGDGHVTWPQLGFVGAVGGLLIGAVLYGYHGDIAKLEKADSDLRQSASRLEEQVQTQREVLVAMLQGEKDKLKLIAKLTQNPKIFASLERFEANDFRGFAMTVPVDGPYGQEVADAGRGMLQAKLVLKTSPDNEKGDILQSMEILRLRAERDAPRP